MAKSKSAIILKNTISNYFRNIVNVLVFLMLTPYVAQNLGTEQFGLWSLLWSTVGLLALFDLGFSPAVVKYIAQARGQEDPKRVSGLTSTFFWVHVIMGTVAMIVACILAPFLGTLLSLPTEFIRPAQIVFLMLAFRVSQSLPLGLFASLLVAFQKESWANYIKSIGTVLYGATVYVVFEYEATVENIGAVNLITTLITNLVILFLATAKLPNIRLSPKWFSKELVKEITGFSIYAVILYVSKLLYTRIDAIIIKLILNLSKVAYYNIAVQTVERAGAMSGQLNRALTPMIAELKGAGDEQTIRNILLKGSKISFALATPLSVGLLWLTEPLIVAWVGEEFRESILPMQILIGTMIVTTLCDGARTILVMTGYHKFITGVSISAQVVNLLLTFVLIYPLNLPGVALATLISVIILNAILLKKACALHQVSLLDFIKYTFVPTIIPTAIMLSTLKGVAFIYKPKGLLDVALMETIACVVFFISFYLIGLSKEERKYYTGRVIGLVKKKRKHAK